MVGGNRMCASPGWPSFPQTPQPRFPHLHLPRMSFSAVPGSHPPSSKPSQERGSLFYTVLPEVPETSLIGPFQVM